MATINDAHECKFSAAVAGMTAIVDGGTKLAKKVFKIFTTSEKLQKTLESFAQHPTMPKDAFAPSRGFNARIGMHYSLELAKIICDAIKPERLRAMMVLESHGRFIGDSNRRASFANIPLWCCMITRTIRMKCQEAKSEACQQAIADELAGHTRRRT